MRKTILLAITFSCNVSNGYGLDVFDKELLKKSSPKVIQLSQSSNAQQKLEHDRPHTYSNRNHIIRSIPVNPTSRNINATQPPLLLDAPIVVNVDKNHPSLNDYPQYIFSGMEGAEIYRQGMREDSEQSVLDYVEAYQPGYKTYEDPAKYMGRADQGVVEDLQFVRGVKPYKNSKIKQNNNTSNIDSSTNKQ